MPKLIKDKNIVEHEWALIRTEDALKEQNLTTGKWLVPFSLYEDVIAANPEAQISFWVSADIDLERLSAFDLTSIPLVAVDFPVFMDGRGFSIARTLREHLDYEGEIRAVGHYIADQVFYLSRCGFNSFEVNDEADENALLEFFDAFSQSYQAGTDEPQPLFRRRA